MESPSEPIAVVEKVSRPSVNAGGKSRRARAAARRENTIRSGSVTFTEHNLPTISFDPTGDTITLPSPLLRWKAITDIEWRDFDMCVRYLIKFARGGGVSDLKRLAGSKIPSESTGQVGPEPSKSDADDTEDKPKA